MEVGVGWGRCCGGEGEGKGVGGDGGGAAISWLFLHPVNRIESLQDLTRTQNSFTPVQNFSH